MTIEKFIKVVDENTVIEISFDPEWKIFNIEQSNPPYENVTLSLTYQQMNGLIIALRQMRDHYHEYEE